MRSPFLFCALSLALAACSPAAPPSAPPLQTTSAPEIVVSDAWARPTPGGVDVAAGYFTIANNGAAEDQLLSASSPRAPHVEVHAMTMDGAVMQMRPAGPLAIAPGETLTLTPGGLHLMFTALPTPFAVGEEVPVTLTFAQAGAVEVTLVVQRDAPEAAHGH
jgi:periplasmic copper chaperone A